MRTIKIILLAVLAVALVVLALANSQMVELRLLPVELGAYLGIDISVRLPMFLVLTGAVLVGLIIGFLWEYIREHKHRAAARVERREKEQMKREIDRLPAETRPAREPGDDIVAIIDGRSAKNA